MADIKAGDKVNHQQGGPEMTVKSVDGDYAVVSFIASDGEPTEKKFPVSMLVKS